MKMKKIWFTLIELIITIMILIILSTIWFSSYSWYIAWVRDTNRITQLTEISNGLDVHKTKYTNPLPDDYVKIIANWETIAYQWYLWKFVLNQIEYSKWWTDPKTNDYFSYYLTFNRKKHQLMAFLEEENETAYLEPTKTNAVDYSNKYPIVNWSKLGILTDELNNPVQEIENITDSWELDLWWTLSWTIYIAHMDESLKYSFSWSILENILYSIAKPLFCSAPKDCPEWFIWVPWDKTFTQPGFCVSKYEMTYSESDSPWTPNWIDYDSKSRNTYDYDDSKTIVARSDYPITNLTQQEAIDACKSMWTKYHLITNSEWMTLARNIEFVNENWSNWNILNWHIHNWNSWSDGNVYWCNWSLYSPNESWNESWPWNDSLCNTYRKQVLIDWAEIWDFAWNLWEHVNKANNTTWSGYNDWNTSLSSSLWSTATISEKSSHWPIVAIDETKWIWKISWYAWVTNNIFIRGWSAHDGDTSWIYSFILDQNSTYKAWNVWFRCVRTR